MFKEFRQLCGRTGSLPGSHVILRGATETRFIAHLKLYDAWEGIYKGNPVAIRVFSGYKDDALRKARKVYFPEIFVIILANSHHKLFCGEAVMWRGFSHPNIVPFLGMLATPMLLSVVSEWMPNGDVQAYVEKNSEVSRLQLVGPSENGPGPR